MNLSDLSPALREEVLRDRAQRKRDKQKRYIAKKKAALPAHGSLPGVQEGSK